MSSLLQNLLIIGGIVLLLAFGYFIYTQNTGLAVSSNSSVSAQVAVETADFLRRLNELKAIQLNGEIFSDERFISLVNYTVPVTAESVGRTNPFDVSSN